ncbi:hypothetical protein FRC04_010628 [Tulasnella sp. 424]|nr:hypothetical protein FRC04_010628 [Tulasnella sp. 424]KAG8972450.1 hypothetical protein FRC05_010043 [Tulasnella sp. 425]
MPPPERVRRKHAQRRDQVLFFTSRILGSRPLDDILQVVPESFRKRTKVLHGWVNPDNKQRYVVLFPDAQACKTVYDRKQVTDRFNWASRQYQNFTLEAKKHSSDALIKVREEEEKILHSVARTVCHDVTISSDPSPLASLTPNWLLIKPQLREQLDSAFWGSFDGVGMRFGFDEVGFPSNHIWVKTPLPEPPKGPYIPPLSVPQPPVYTAD